jgi:hypothetical protein
MTRDIVGLLLVVFMILAGAAYLTSIPCRMVLARQQRPRWILGVVAAVMIAILGVLLAFQGRVFHPNQWSEGKGTPLGIAMLIVLTFVFLVGLVPALYVVWLYRRTYGYQTRAG